MSVSACSKSPRNERGAVLIIALLVVSLVAGLSVRFTGDYQLAQARAESRWLGAQLRNHLLGAESLASYVLEEDPDLQVDYYEEGWGVTQDVELDGVWVTVAITDAQSYINLNDLGGALDPDQSMGDPQRYSPPQRRFIRLLQTFEEQVPLNPDEAAAVLEAVVDWMDADSEASGFAGAEADYYMGLETEYRPANTVFTSVEELRLVRHVSEELMTLIRPYLVVLPEGARGVPLNVNTLPRRLLRTLNGEGQLTPLDPMQVELLVQERTREGFYPSVQDFRGNAVWQSLGITPPADLAASSNHFMMEAEATVNEQRRAMRSLLLRNGDQVEVKRRRDIYEITRFPEQAQAGQQ